jgi:hypothetical protein
MTALTIYQRSLWAYSLHNGLLKGMQTIIHLLTFIVCFNVFSETSYNTRSAIKLQHFIFILLNENL